MSRCAQCGRLCPCAQDYDEILQLAVVMPDDPESTRIYSAEDLRQIERAHIASEDEGDGA